MGWFRIIGILVTVIARTVVGAFIRRVVRLLMARNPRRAALDKDTRSTKRRHPYEAPDNDCDCKNPHGYSLYHAFTAVNESQPDRRTRMVTN